MSFLETPRFPVNVSINFTGGPSYLTELIVTNSGDESRNQVWANARHSYDAAYAAKLPKEWKPLRAFFHVARGRANGFRVKDWFDYKVPDESGTGVLNEGFANGTPYAQLGKKYTQGANSTVRAIVKPVTSVAPKIFKNGVEIPEVTDWEVDLSTGIVTFVPSVTKVLTNVSNANPAVVTAAAHGFTNGQTVYLYDVAGIYQVNLQAFTVAGATTNTFQLAGIDSRNYGVFTSGGHVGKYLQPSDALTWTGEFDVPCRFDTDKMIPEVVDKHPDGDFIVTWQSIPIVEIRFP